MDIKIAYLRALNNVSQELKIEKAKVQEGHDSLWTMDALMTIVQPEIKQLLIYASRGEVYFKYGDNHRTLESTYFISESALPLANTELGKSILDFQDIYNSL